MLLLKLQDAQRPSGSSGIAYEFREGSYVYLILVMGGGSVLGAQQHVLQGKLGLALIHCSYGQCESLHAQGGGVMWLWEGRAGRHIVRALLSVQKPYDSNSTGLTGEANWV